MHFWRPKAQDVAVVIAKEKEELEKLSAGLGAKPPVTVTRASATASQNLPGMPVGMHGILMIRPKITTTLNLTGVQSLVQPILPTTFEQATSSYKPLQCLFKNRLNNIVCSALAPPAEEVVKQAMVEIPLEQVAAEVLRE